MSVFDEIAKAMAKKAIEHAKAELKKEQGIVCKCPLPGCRIPETQGEEQKP